MAMLDRQGISQELLRNDGESTLQFRAAISKLKAFSFIIEEKKMSKYSMHRLVQLSTQQWLEHLGKVSFPGACGYCRLFLLPIAHEL